MKFLNFSLPKIFILIQIFSSLEIFSISKISSCEKLELCPKIKLNKSLHQFLSLLWLYSLSLDSMPILYTKFFQSAQKQRNIFTIFQFGGIQCCFAQNERGMSERKWIDKNKKKSRLWLTMKVFLSIVFSFYKYNVDSLAWPKKFLL